MKGILDIHTHNKESICGIINYDVAIDNYVMDAYKHYSVGIHPWNVELCTEQIIEKLEKLAKLSCVIAIGECGVDKVKCRENLEQQIKMFELHVSLSEQVKKPLIIHCVKAADIILKEKKLLNPAQQWIYHGFRGNEVLAGQLIDAGIYISIGEKYNINAAEIAAKRNMLLFETDCSAMPIKDIIADFSGEHNAAK